MDAPLAEIQQRLATVRLRALCERLGDPQVEDLQQSRDTTQCGAPADGLFAKLDEEVPIKVGVRSIEDARESVDTADPPRQSGSVDEDLLRPREPDLKSVQLGLLDTDRGK